MRVLILALLLSACATKKGKWNNTRERNQSVAKPREIPKMIERDVILFYTPLYLGTF